MEHLARKTFLRPLDEDVRVRFMIEIERGKVKDFLVQLEILHESGWKACVRFNYAHGKPHRDLIHMDGTKEKKLFEVKDLGRFINEAYQDLTKNFRVYAERMGYG